MSCVVVRLLRATQMIRMTGLDMVAAVSGVVDSAAVGAFVADPPDKVGVDGNESAGDFLKKVLMNTSLLKVITDLSSLHSGLIFQDRKTISSICNTCWSL
jgi:hypothetical protein